MEELCQPTMNGRGRPIAPVNIQATDFELKNHMIQQVQNSCQFHGLPGDDANKHLDKFLIVTQSMKQNGVTDDALRLYLFPYSLTHHATAWHRDTINAAAGGTFMKRRPKECYDLIENMTEHHHDWDTSAQRGESSKSITSSSFEIAALTQQMAEMRKDMLQMYRINQQVNSVSPGCETCGGPHSYYECQAASGYTQDVYATSGTYNQGGNTYRTQDLKRLLLQRPQGVLPSNTEPNPREQVNSIMTRSGLTTVDPSFLPPVPPIPRVEVEKEPETLMDEVHITSPGSTTHVPPPSDQPVSPPKPKEDPKPNPHQPKIPYPSRLNKTKLLDKNDVQIFKFLKILKQLHFDVSLMDALTLIPKFTKVLLNLLKDKEKLEELANTPINAEYSAIILNKVPKKLEDPGKFLIPCILHDLKVYSSLADSGASINLMPLSIFEKLGIGPLKSTRMTLELANRFVTYPKGITEDVIIKVEKLNFLSDFVIVDFEADPRVPIILGRPFLRTAKALMDLYEEKLTLRVENEEVVFYTDKSSRNNPSDIQSVHCINIIDFSRDKPISGSTTFPSDSSPSSPLVETSDSLLEEFVDELALLDPFPPGNEDDKFNLEADLREIKYLLNRDPSIVSSPTTDIDIVYPVLERFTDEPALFYSSPPGDDDDDLFDLKSDNDEWKKLLYGDSYNDTHSKNDKTKDPKTKSLIDEANIVESNVLSPQLLTSDSTLLEESSETTTLLSYPFGNEDKVFNPGILIFDGTRIFNDESKDKDLKDNGLILEECNFLSISTDQELLFFLELTVIETLLSFLSENKDKVFNPEILISKRVQSPTLGLSYRTFKTLVINVHLNILNEGLMKIFPFFCFCPKDKGIRGESS
ncbi:reverse transcriptase domain-containing protein [Tanacetum coccineum]